MNEVIAQLFDDVSDFLRSGGLLVDGDDDGGVGLDAVDSFLVLLASEDGFSSGEENELGLGQDDAVSLEMSRVRVVGGEGLGFSGRKIQIRGLGPNGSIQSDDGGGLDQSSANQLFVDVILPRHFLRFGFQKREKLLISAFLIPANTFDFYQLCV